MMDLNSLSPEEFGIGAPAPTTIQPMAILDPQAGASLADVPPLPMTSPMGPPQEAPVNAPTGAPMGGGLALPPAPPIPTRQKPTTPARPQKPLTPTQQRDAAVQQQIAGYDEAKVLAGQEAGVNAATSRKLEEQQWQNIQDQESKVAREEQFARDVDDHVQREMGTLDKDLQDIKEQKINPNQTFQNMGIAGQMMAALSVGMASVGDAILGNKSNSALDRINQMIDRDIAIQERNLANKKDAAKMKDSLIGRMAEQGASKLDRMQRMRIAGYEMGKQKLAAIAQSGDTELQRVNAGKAINALSQKQAAEMQSFQERKIAEARAAAAAGAAAKKLEWERAKDIRELDLKEGAQRIQQTEAGIKAAEAGYTLGPKGEILPGTGISKQAREGAEKYAEALDKKGLPGMEADLKRAEDLIGMEKGKEKEDIPGLTGEIVPFTPNPFGVQGFLKRNVVPTSMLSEKGGQVQQAMEAVKGAAVKASSGLAASDKEYGRIAKQLEGAGTPQAFRAALAQLRAKIEADKQNLAAGYDPAAIDLYKSRGGQGAPATKAEKASKDIDNL